jgi:predicted Zn-dependent protease with MMP-like domain
MNISEFQFAAEQAMAALPSQFRDAMENVVICVEDEADGATLAEMQSESPSELLGLYRGWPLPERGVSYAGHLPDTIHLYRKPILQFCDETGEEPDHCIRHVLIHEIGHYFGYSDEEMEAIEKEAVCLSR